MKNLSKREKILMYILVYILIFVGGVFLLCMPAFEKYTSLKTEYDSVQSKWSLTKAGEVDYENLDKKIEEATTAYKAQLDNFYLADETHAEDIDQLLTSLAVDHLLKPMSLDITDIVQEDVMNYKDFVQEQAKKADAAKATGQETTEDVEKSKISTTSAKVYNVTLTVTGTISDLQAFINNASNNKTLKIHSVTYESQEDAAKTMTMSFKVFMI